MSTEHVPRRWPAPPQQGVAPSVWALLPPPEVPDGLDAPGVIAVQRARWMAAGVIGYDEGHLLCLAWATYAGAVLDEVTGLMIRGFWEELKEIAREVSRPAGR